MAAACVSGSVLSSLFHEHTNSPGDQEGFLLGQIVSHVKDTITDSQISGCKVETITNVYSFIPSPYTSTWYNRNGEINKPKLDALLQGRTKELVGWYKFRRNSTSQVSMKENSLHRKLLKLVSNGQEENFLFCLCTSSTTTNCSTHNLDHSFQVYFKGSFRCVPLSVCNLGDSVQNVYKNRNNLTVNHSAGVYSSLISRFIPEFTDQDGEIQEVQKMNVLAEKLQSQLQLLCNVVNDSEKELEKLESELAGVRDRVESKREKERLKQPLPPSPEETPKSIFPIDMDTAGPPPYADRKQKPSKSVFTPEDESGEITRAKIEKTLATSTVEITEETPVGMNTYNNVDNNADSTLCVEGSIGQAVEKLSDSPLTNRHMDTANQPLSRTLSLPTKRQEEPVTQKPEDHFSFIESVLKEAKVSTPVRSSSLRLSEKHKSSSLDDSKHQRSNSGPPKPPRSFQTDSDSSNLNSSLADTNAPSTIDRNDRLRCKPVQRTRSRTQRSKSREENPDPDDNTLPSDKGDNLQNNTTGPSIALAPSNSVTKDTLKLPSSKRKTRTRAQVQAERAALAASKAVPASSSNDPDCKMSSLPSGCDTANGSNNPQMLNDDTDSIEIVPGNNKLPELGLKGSSSPVY